LLHSLSLSLCGFSARENVLHLAFLDWRKCATIETLFCLILSDAFRLLQKGTTFCHIQSPASKQPLVDYFSHFAFGENCVAADNTHPWKIVVLENSLFLLSFGAQT